MLDLFVTVVRENAAKLRIDTRVDALVVPIDGFQLLDQRDDGAVEIHGLGRELVDGFVIAFMRHCNVSSQI
mgnify:CR=1 FL=1